MEHAFTVDELSDEELSREPIDPPEPQQSLNEISRFLAPAMEIPKKSYSLEPDMINGWRPPKRLLLNSQTPFGLSYDNRILDPIVSKLLSARNHTKYLVVYLGERPGNSYQLHENLANLNDEHINPYPYDKRVPVKTERPFTQMNPRLKKNESLVFSSNFESGNLDAAIKISECQYDLFMRVDTNTKGHTNWYYFTVKNGEFLGKVRFNICNFQKTKSLYQRGMKPYVLSENSQEKYGSGWRQCGTDTSYLNTPLRYNQQESLDEDSDEDMY